MQGYMGGNVDTVETIVRDRGREWERGRGGGAGITACPPGLRETKQNNSVTGAK